MQLLARSLRAATNGSGPLRQAVLPPKPFLRGMLVRATVVWVFLHALGTARPDILLPDGMPTDPGAFGSLLGPGLGLLLVWAVTGIVVVSEMHRREEVLFLANLGISRRRILALVVVWCAVLDGVLLGIMAVAG